MEFLHGKYYVVAFIIANKQIERKVELPRPTCSIRMYFRKIIQNNYPPRKKQWHVLGGTPILDGQFRIWATSGPFEIQQL
jgi:hypothetical protein